MLRDRRVRDFLPDEEPARIHKYERRPTGGVWHSGQSAELGPSAARSRSSRGRCRHAAFALSALTRQLAGAADCLGLLASLLFGGLFVIVAKLHLAEDALTLELLFQCTKCLIDIVIANNYLQAQSPFLMSKPVPEQGAEANSFCADRQGRSPWGRYIVEAHILVHMPRWPESPIFEPFRR